MRNSINLSHYNRTATWILVLYLSAALSGCSFRPAELNPEEARLLQTREFNNTPEDVAKAAVIVLQDMHYTLDNVDLGLGIITANRSSERKLAPISREAMTQEEIDQGIKTFFIVAGIIAVVGFLLAFVFNDSDDDGDDDDHNYRETRHHHHNSTPIFVGSDNHGPDSYYYSMTIALEELALGQTKVRVTVQGQRKEGSRVTESGPVQTDGFYSDFYNRLNIALNK